MNEKNYLVLEKDGYKLTYPCKDIENLKKEHGNEKNNRIIWSDV